MPWRVPLLLAAPLGRVFNDYDFGGYLIANGVAPFIDGRTELYGEKFFVDHSAATGPEPGDLFRLLDAYKCAATLMRAQSAAITARSCRWPAEGVRRRHCHHPSQHGWRGGQRRPRGGTWSGIRAELPAELIFYRIAFVVGSRNDVTHRIVPLIVQTYCVTEFLSPPVQFVFTKKEKKKGEGQWPD